MKKLLPILVILLGIGGGGAAGFLLRPPPPEPVAENPCGDVGAHAVAHVEDAPPDEPSEEEFVKMNNQFIVPLVDGQTDRIGGLVVISLTLQVALGQREVVYQLEPKLRDAFLQVMFDHANMGGFNGAFTNSSNLDVLRASLLNVARKNIGPQQVTDVLITDIARQDV